MFREGSVFTKMHQSIVDAALEGEMGAHVQGDEKQNEAKTLTSETSLLRSKSGVQADH